MAESALRNLNQIYMMGIGQGPVAPRPERTRGQEYADMLGAASIPMSAIPIAGDITGLAADAAMYSAYPEERTMGNYAMSALGVLPLVPGAAALRAARDAPTVIPGEIGFDPRFDPRVKEQERIASSQFRYTESPQVEIPEISIYDLEGKPFILGMADRTAAGRSLTGIDDVTFDTPVDLRGGQDYMFYNPGQVWASDKGPVSAMLNSAARMSPASMLGGVVENPLFLPFRMAPSGGDYSTMVTDAMLSYARSNMNKKTIREANKDIKAIYPDFKGIENPESMQQLYGAGGDVRKAVQQLLDIKYRDRGGINIGQARLSATDPSQYSAMDVGLGNVGVIEPQRPRFAVSGHPTYEQGIPGYGLGALKERDISAFDLLPDLVQQRGVNINNPDPKDIYTLRLGVRGGRITESALRGIEARRLSGQ